MLPATSPELPQLKPTMSLHGMDRSSSCTGICQLRRLAPEDIAALKATNFDPLQQFGDQCVKHSKHLQAMVSLGTHFKTI